MIVKVIAMLPNDIEIAAFFKVGHDIRYVAQYFGISIERVEMAIRRYLLQGGKQ